MSREDFHSYHISLRKFLTNVGNTHLDAFCCCFDTCFTYKKHIVVSNKNDNNLGINPFNTTVIKPPQQILRFLTTYPKIDRFIFSKLFLPRCIQRFVIKRPAPLLSDTIAKKQDINWAFVGTHMINEFSMYINPACTTKVACRWADRPHRRKMFLRLRSWAPFVLRLQNELTLFLGQGPTGLLRLHSFPRILKCKPCKRDQ